MDDQLHILTTVYNNDNVYFSKSAPLIATIGSNYTYNFFIDNQSLVTITNFSLQDFLPEGFTININNEIPEIQLSHSTSGILTLFIWNYDSSNRLLTIEEDPTSPITLQTGESLTITVTGKYVE